MARNRVSVEEAATNVPQMATFAKRVTRFPVSLFRQGWEVGKEDPRRAIHALKVGLSLTLVSLLYLVEPLFQEVGQNSIWAVMTVVVILEFTAGATLCKGLNRGFGTVCAASLAFVIELVVVNSGHLVRAIFIGVSVFVIGATCSFVRFIPYIKKNYDYGVVIFLLTFNLITVPSYRVHKVLQVARERICMIAIGCGLCLLMSILVFPNWSGEELHNSMVTKLDALATSIEACVNGYFQDEDIEAIRKESSTDPIYKGYRAVLDAKSSEEALASFASWEPRHSRHCYRFPWQQYVKLGTVLRHFGYTAVSLHGCLQSEIQTPKSGRVLFRDPCTRLAKEIANVLIELGNSIRDRRLCSPNVLSDHLQEAIKDLNSAIKSQPRLFLGSDQVQATNMLAVAAAAARQRDKSSGVSLSSVKTDGSALTEWRHKRVVELSKESERKVLRPTLSKIVITSLEFSEALPFAAFASLLVETAARLELVIEEVEELGRIAGFREYKGMPNVVSQAMKPTDNQFVSHPTD